MPTLIKIRFIDFLSPRILSFLLHPESPLSSSPSIFGCRDTCTLRFIKLFLIKMLLLTTCKALHLDYNELIFYRARMASSTAWAAAAVALVLISTLSASVSAQGLYSIELLQGWAKRWTPDSVNMKRKSCFLLPATGGRTQIFTSFS